MKVPKTLRTFCPKCKTHTEFTVTIYKAGKRQGSRKGERDQAIRKKGYGGQKFPMQHNQAKGTKWSDLRRSHGYEKPHNVRYWCLGKFPGRDFTL